MIKSEKLKVKSQKLGFTLVELLVVIVVLGILAVALLMGINPLEQIRKGRDAGKVSSAKEVINAAERVNTFSGEEPTCAELISLYDELKGDICGDIIAGTISYGTPITVDIFVESQAYFQLCGSTTCTIPTSIEDIGGT